MTVNNKTDETPNKNSARHTSYSSAPKRLLPYGEGYLLSDQNLFPEAIELLGSLGELERDLGPETRQDPIRFSRKIMDRVARYCGKADETTTEMVEGTLSDFGEFLLIRGIQGRQEPVNQQAFILLRQLYQASNQRSFLKSLVQIKQFCSSLL